MDPPESDGELTGTKEELAAHLATRLQGKFPDAQACQSAISPFIADAAKLVATIPPPGGLGLVVRHYAIRKDDVQIFETVMSAVGASASASFFAGGAGVVTAVTGIVTAILRFVWRLRSSGVLLDDDKVRLLTILRANVRTPSDQGMTAPQILAIVQRTSPDKDLAWINAQLADLANMPVRTGMRAIVSSNHAGEWRPHV